MFCYNSKKRVENKKIAIRIFDKDSIDKCREYNVEIQDLEFTTELIKKGNETIA